MTSVDAREPHDEGTVGQPADSGLAISVVDKPVETTFGMRLGLRQFALVFVLVVVPIIAITVLAVSLRLNPLTSGIMIVGVVGAFFLILYILLNPTDDALHKTVDELGPQEALSIRMESSVWKNAHKVIMRTLSAAVASGHRGVLYRFLPSSELGAVEPIRVPFEPMVLDESDDRLVELMNETSGGTASPAPPSKRNIRRAGGWLVVGIFGFNVLIQVFRAIALRRVTWELFYWSVLLLLMYFGVGRSVMLGTFLAVPGGLVTRKLRGIQRNVSLHVYTAADSVLCIYRATKNLWIISVADDKNAQWTTCAPAEARFAMAAWTSPIAPPTKAQLSEL